MYYLNVLPETRVYVIFKCHSFRGAGHFRQDMAVSFRSRQTGRELFLSTSEMENMHLSIYLFSKVINLMYDTVRLLAL